jgi:spermidine synthase
MQLQSLPFYLVLFLSGSAGLGYEMVWTRMLSSVLGHEIISILAVVAAFFGGVALGSWALDRPVGNSRYPGRWYAALELAIGLWSAFLTILFPWASGIAFELMGGDPANARLWGVAFMFSFLLLFPATFAMGGTLPAMERLCSRLRRKGRWVGGLYAANTFGAVAGTLAATFWITPAWGVKNTQLLLAAINFFCAAWILLGAFGGGKILNPIETVWGSSSSALRIYFSLFITGLLGIGYEVLGMRALSQVLENTAYSFACVLSVYLLGLALGGALYQAWSSRLKPRTVMGYLAPVLSLACVASSGSMLIAEDIYWSVKAWFPHGVTGALIGELCAASALFLLPTVFMGMIFTHLAQSTCGEKGGLGRALCVNTLGAATAPFLFGVVLLPALGIKTALALVAAGYLLLVPFRGPWTLRAISFISLGSCGLMYLWPFSLQLVEVPPGGKVVEYVEGVMASVSVVSDPARHLHLKVNNHYQMGGTSSVYSDRRQGHIPLLLHPDPKKALFLGMGTGATLAATLDHPELHSEGVELIPEIIPLLPYFRNSAGELASDPRIKIVVADARRYVNTSPKSYDVIVADLFHPSRDGAGSLYTLEHFTAIRSRLSNGGVFCQWLPLYQMDLETLRIITRTFLTVFPEATAYLAHYSLKAPIVGLVANLGGKTYPATWLEKRVRDANLAQKLRDLRLHTNFNLFGCFLAGASELRRFAGYGPLNTDNRPLVTYQAPRFAYANTEPIYRPLFALLDFFQTVPEQVVAPARDARETGFQRRLAAYWTARNDFMKLGAGVRETDDVRELLSQVKEPLLAIVRVSRDFDLAYTPLLMMAQRLAKIDPKAAEQLLTELGRANPDRRGDR